MSRFWIKKLKGGSFAVGSALRGRVEGVLAPRVKRAAMVGQGTLQKGTPRVSGHLARGYNTGEPQWSGSRYIAKIGNPVVYLRRVNKTSKRNAGFIERGMADARPRALTEIKQGLGELASVIWSGE